MHELLENHWNLINDKAKWSLFRHSLWNVRQSPTYSYVVNINSKLNDHSLRQVETKTLQEYTNYAWKQINLQHDNELR